MPASRRLLRAGLVTLAAWLLLGGAIGVVSADDGEAESFVLPPVLLGDRARYDAEGFGSDESPVGTFNVGWTALDPVVYPDGTWHAVDALSTELDLSEVLPDQGDDPFSGTASLDLVYEAGTHSMAALGLSGNISQSSAGDVLASLVQQQTDRNERVQVTVFLPEGMGPVEAPDCLFGGLWGGQEIRADGTLQLPRMCAPILAMAFGSGLTLHGRGIEEVDGVRAIRFSGSERIGSIPMFGGDVDLGATLQSSLDLWLSPASPFPLRVESTLSYGGTSVERGLALATFERGDQPRVARAAPDTPAPAIRMAPVQGLTPFRDDDTGHPFPLSAAIEAARNQDADVALFLQGHPDAYAVSAEGAQMSTAGQPQFGWRFTLADHRDSLSVLVLQTQPGTASQLPPGLAGLLSVHQVTSELGDGPGPRRSDLPGELPTVGSLLDLWEWQRPGQGVGQTWMYDLRPGSSLQFLEETEREEPTLNVAAGRFVGGFEVTGVDQSGLRFASAEDVDIAILDPSGSTLGLLTLVSAETTQVGPATTAAPPSAPPSAFTASVAGGGWLPTPAQAAGAGLVAVLLGVLYWLWPKLKVLAFAGLFSRVAPARLLEHPGRARLLEIIQAEPGIHFQELVRRSGLATGTAVHHLNKLARGELIACRPLGRYTCYFPGSSPDRQSLLAAPLLRSEGARQVYEAILGTPDLSGLELAQRTGLQASTVNYHVQRLTEAGLVAARRDGRAVRVRAAAAATSA